MQIQRENIKDNKKNIKLIFRLISVLLVIYVSISLFAPIPESGYKVETISNIDVEEYYSGGGRTTSGHYGQTVTIFTDQLNNYCFDLNNQVPFNIADTIFVSQNVFGKKVGVVHNQYYYPIDTLDGVLILLLIVTIAFSIYCFLTDLEDSAPLIVFSVLTVALLIFYLK